LTLDPNVGVEALYLRLPRVHRLIEEEAEEDKVDFWGIEKAREHME
jgi:hypothetical protein